MPQHHPLTITVNDQLTIDAGSWQECVEEDQTPYRLISPPHIAMYRQALSYLEEATKDVKAPPKSHLHFGDGEMARINIEASAALASWIDLMRADQQGFRKLVKAAAQLLPFPIAQLDESTYYNRFRALGALNSANARRYLMVAFARGFGSEWLEREKARVLVHPTRALANGILNEHWRSGSGVEDIHSGGIAPPRPLTQCRLTKAQETLLMQEAAELFVPTLRALYHVVGKPSGETWPEQALPYAIAFKPPADWSLEEQTREIALPGAEPQ